ncbi:MAG: mechanosensitive ion channel family protein, partial [Nitrososphaerales archaeon]
MAEGLDLVFQVALAGGIAVAWIAAGFIVRYILKNVLSKLAQKTKTHFDDIVFKSIKTPVVIWFTLSGIGTVLVAMELPENLVSTLQLAISAVLTFSIAYFIADLLAGIVRFYGDKLGIQAMRMTSIGGYTVRAVVLAIGLIYVLTVFEVEISPLVASLGIGAIAVALALQPTLQNVFAAMYLLADKPVRVGDYVKLDSGQSGYVQDVGWRSTKIKMLPNNMIIIPNERLASTIITNFHMPEQKMSVLIDIGTSYDDDPYKVEEVVVDEAVKASYEIDGMLNAEEARPFVRFYGFKESSLGYTLIIRVKEFVDQYYVGHEMRKRLFRRFKKEG